MPRTVNGTGTQYIGRKKVHRQQGTCRFCGSKVYLETYETQLCVTIFFIPVIPLGRKKIVELCPVCGRHFAFPADRWEMARQLDISGAVERFRADPAPETALAAHGQMLSYHEFEMARQARQEIVTRFAENAHVHSGLGRALQQIGKASDSEQYFSKALSLDPELADARIGAGLNAIWNGKNNDAQMHLHFLRKPGAAQLYSLEPLEMLANAYQHQGRHAEALDLYQNLLEAVPEIGQAPNFRQRVQTSEKALRKTETILPKRKRNWRDLFAQRPNGKPAPLTCAVFVLVVALLMGFGFAAQSEFQRRHRTVYLANGFPKPLSVIVDGRTKVLAAPHKVTQFETEEGPHHASVSGATTQEIDFNVETSSFLSRWFDHPVWVLNPGGEALLMEQAVRYAAHPTPPTIQFHFEPFTVRNDIGYPFRNLPKSISSESEQTLTQLEMPQGSPADLAENLQSMGMGDRALELAEWRLSHHPDDQTMLLVYVDCARRSGQVKRAVDFFKAGLERRPVQIEWHRSYQELKEGPGKHDELIAEYDSYLAKDSTNSALLYLRGRISSSRKETRQFFTSAALEDPSNPWAQFGLGSMDMKDANWAAARSEIEKALATDPENRIFAESNYLCRLALKDLAALESESRLALRKDTLDFNAAEKLCTILAEQERIQDVYPVVEEFGRHARARFGDDGAAKPILLLQCYASYVVGDFAALERYARKDVSPKGSEALFHALIEERQIRQAVPVLPAPADPHERGIYLLTVAIALAAENDAASTRSWCSEAAHILAKGNADDVHAAEALGGSGDPLEVDYAPQDQAILLTAITCLHPEKKEYARTAGRLNVLRTFPYHLLARVTKRLAR